MEITFHPEAISISAPAKLNLFLQVLGKRPDGFHELETVMCPISLCDQLEFEFSSDPSLTLELELPEGVSADSQDPAWQIPTDQRNLVLRAMERVREAFRAVGGCRVKLRKSIPAAAGLGGGSSDAAAAVVGAMIGWGKWDRKLATEICASLGSDIPFFLGDEQQIGMALATGRGEKCQILPERPEFDFVVTHPPVGCATSAVYAGFQPASSSRSAMDFVAACRSGDREQVGSLLFNSLESSARTLTEWIDKQLTVLTESGCKYKCMSGSGSSCFALISDARTMSVSRRVALDAGLTRVYAVKSWYSSSVEEQIRLSGLIS